MRYDGLMKCVSDITYASDPELAMDVYLPASLTASACILFLHGGGFHKGTRDGVEVGHFAEQLTAAGFAMASITYRLGAKLDSYNKKQQGFIEAYSARTKKLGLKLSPKLYGPAYIAALEDVSKAIEYLWVEGDGLGIKSRKLGVLGVSAGGIAGLGAAYPPTHWMASLSRPDAVVAISSAIVQPWRLHGDGPSCLLIHGPRDRVIDIKDPKIGMQRAAWVNAPFELLETKVPGHASQVDLILDGSSEDDTPYMQRIIDHFAVLEQD